MEVETIPNAGPETTSTQETPATQVATGADAQTTGGETNQRPTGNDTGGEQPSQLHKIKYGKNERELSLDELKVMAQKGWAADDRFQQAAQMKKEMEALVKQAKWDKLIEKQTGKPALEYYKDQLKAEIRRQQMTPEEREAEDRKANIEKIRAEEAEVIKAREERQIAEQEAHYSKLWDKELSEAIEKEGLPKNKYAIGRAVAIGKKVVDMGLDPDWGLVVKEAKAQMLDDVRNFISAFKDANGIVGFLGDEMSMKISKALVDRKNPVKETTKKAVESRSQDQFRAKEVKAMDVDQWIAERRRKFEEG